MDEIIFGSTPIYNENDNFMGGRSMEIINWFNKTNILHKINNYVIFDDLKLDSKSDIINKHFVRTDIKVGITKNDIQNAINILEMK